MARTLALLLVALISAVSLSGCATEYEVRPACTTAYWVPAHRGYYGRWHRGHWRCR